MSFLDYPAKHPIWSILRIAVTLGGLALILYATASTPDWTELRTWLMALLPIGAGELMSRRGS